MQEVIDAAVANKSLFNVKRKKIRCKWKTIDIFKLSKPLDADEEDSSALLKKIDKDMRSYLKNKASEKIFVLQKVIE